MSSSAHQSYDHYARYRRDLQENGSDRDVSHGRPLTRRETLAELPMSPPPYQSYEGTYANYVAPTPKQSTTPGLQFNDSYKFEQVNQSYEGTHANYVAPTPKQSTTPGLQFDDSDKFKNQSYEGTSVNFGLPTPSLSASPGLHFDEYGFEALDAINASLEANKRYCYRFDRTQRSIQSSPEAVSKRRLLAELCTQFVLKRFPYHSGEHSTVLYHDIFTVLHELSSDGEAAHGALLLLERVRKLCDKETYPKESSQFELFLAAFIISHKFLEDRSHRSRTWVTVSNNKFTPQHIEKMQKRMLRVLEWNVSFTGHELSVSKTKISQEFKRSRPRPL